MMTPCICERPPFASRRRGMTTSSTIMDHPGWSTTLQQTIFKRATKLETVIIKNNSSRLGLIDAWTRNVGCEARTTARVGQWEATSFMSFMAMIILGYYCYNLASQSRHAVQHICHAIRHTSLRARCRYRHLRLWISGRRGASTGSTSRYFLRSSFDGKGPFCSVGAGGDGAGRRSGGSA